MPAFGSTVRSLFVQPAVLNLLAPQALPFHPEASRAHEAGSDEPIDHAGR
jgi:hypothetical protein